MNLYQYLVGRVTNAGLQPSDIVLVEFETELHGWLGTRDVAAFAQVAQQVMLADIPVERRERIRLWVQPNPENSATVFQWSNAAGNFVVVPPDPEEWTPSVSDLTGA